MDSQLLTWQHAKDGLAITIGRRIEPIPAAIASWLIGPSGFKTTADPGADVIRLEFQLRIMAAELSTEVGCAEQRVRDARAASAAAAGPWWSWAARRQWATNSAELDAAISAHEVLVSAYRNLRTLQAELRQYVIDLGVTSGLLAEAARGWRRSPEIPAGVVVIDDEDSLLLADSRRADEGGFPVIGGDVLGRGWRRDGDEDNPEQRPLDRTGPWMLGWIARTGEIYATRRAPYLPGQVWLFGSGFTADEAYALLDELAPRRTEPNSLLLVADRIGRTWQREQFSPAHDSEPQPRGPQLPAGPADPTSSVVLGEPEATP